MVTSIDKKIYVIRIRQLMTEKGIKEKGTPYTGRELARKLRVSGVIVNNTIRFESRSKSPRIRRGIAGLLDAPYEYLWGEPDPTAR